MASDELDTSEAWAHSRPAWDEAIAAARAALAAKADGPAVPDGEPPSWCESDAEQRAWQAGWEARDDVMLRPLAPPAQSEVEELLEELRRICFDVAPCDADTIKRAADLLEQRHPTPVPVSERLPGPGDCDALGYCWWWDPLRQESWEYCITGGGPDWYWLPFNALPLPQWEV